MHTIYIPINRCSHYCIDTPMNGMVNGHCVQEAMYVHICHTVHKHDMYVAEIPHVAPYNNLWLQIMHVHIQHRMFPHTLKKISYL